jgi:outer membrane protein assembly factor BamA
MSFKPGEDGVEIPVHMDFIKLDFPGLANGKLRLILGLHYDQVNNSGYFGVGNAANYVKSYWDPERNEVVEPDSDMYKYQRMEPKLRVFMKYRLMKNLELAFGLRFMWMKVTAFDDTKLSDDMAGLYGLDPHFGLQFATGVIYDTRDHEYNPVKGMYIESSLRFSPGLDNDMHFGAFGLDARFFVPLLGPQLSFASRWMVDMLFGNVPFYEMARAGAFEPIEFIGGRMGLSGIPEGRYHGKVKVGANLELRSQMFPIQIKKIRLMFGTAAFCNVGRVWADYSGNEKLDGTGLGLKVAAGAGLRIQFGETVIVRADLAWAKEAQDAGSPVGIYLDAYHPF